jgi:hypothetical protein
MTKKIAKKITYPELRFPNLSSPVYRLGGLHHRDLLKAQEYLRAWGRGDLAYLKANAMSDAEMNRTGTGSRKAEKFRRECVAHLKAYPVPLAQPAKTA